MKVILVMSEVAFKWALENYIQPSEHETRALESVIFPISACLIK